MTDELKKAVLRAEKLSDEQQKLIAKVILDEIEWGRSFDSSAKELSILAKEAISDFRTGKFTDSQTIETPKS